MPSKKCDAGSIRQPARRKRTKTRPETLVCAEYAVPEYAIWECTACLSATPAGACAALFPDLDVSV